MNVDKKHAISMHGPTHRGSMRRSRGQVNASRFEISRLFFVRGYWTERSRRARLESS